MEIARHALLDLRHAPFHLGLGEVPVAIIHRLELAAIDRNAGSCQQTDLPAQFNEPRADLADGGAVILAEVGDRLVVGSKAACARPRGARLTANPSPATGWKAMLRKS